MESMADYMASCFLESLRGKTLVTASRWAEARMMMGSPFIGPYSFKYFPWARAIHDSQAHFTVCQKSAQAGITTVGINRALFTLDQLKRDVLYVLPTSLNASDFSKSRFTSAVNLSPYLQGLFTETNAVGIKSTGVNNLYIRGSRGDSNLKSVPVSLLCLDEMDEMSQKAIYLAMERLSGQVEKNVLALSTPTIPKYGIHKLFLDSTQEHFFFKCPCCGRRTELVWPDCVEIVGESTGDPRCKESFYRCKDCKNKLDHQTKHIWLADGEWQITNHNADPAESRGFYINQMYSSTVTPGELVIAYHRGQGDEAANKEFHNSKIGIPFVGEGGQLCDADIDAALKSHTINDPRPNTTGRCFTLGCDQGKWLHYSVVEWLNVKHCYDIHANALARLVCFGKVPGDETGWSFLNSLMREWMILACVVDADPEINSARAFARRFPGYVWLTRFRRGKTAKEIAVTEEDGGSPMATVDRTGWLSCTLGKFRTKPPRIELPRDLTLEYREHLKALVRTYEKDETGNPVSIFKSVGQDHFAFSLTYASIALPFAASIASNQSIEKFL